MRTNNNTERVAPWPQPPSLQTAALVPPHSAPKQRGQTYCPADPPSFLTETKEKSAMQVP